MNINVDPESINKMVSDAILQSAIGKSLETAIKRVVGSLDNQYNNPLDPVISQYIAEEARKVLLANHTDQIRAALAKRLSEKLTDDFIEKIVEAADRNLR
jgi:hypothetical protein